MVKKRSNNLLLGAIGAILCCGGLFGCDLVDDYPHRFTHGQIVPNARVVIELPEPRTLAQLYPKYIEAASRGGFVHTKGLTGSRPLAKLLDGEGVSSVLTWVERPNQTTFYQRQLTFKSEFNTRDEPVLAKRVAARIIFMFGRDNLGSFTKEEWLEFFVFYEDILPDVFPDADISIGKHRHPAAFTDKEILRQIHEETDIEIPEKYLAKLEEESPVSE